MPKMDCQIAITQSKKSLSLEILSATQPWDPLLPLVPFWSWSGNIKASQNNICPTKHTCRYLKVFIVHFCHLLLFYSIQRCYCAFSRCIEQIKIMRIKNKMSTWPGKPCWWIRSFLLSKRQFQIFLL